LSGGRVQARVWLSWNSVEIPVWTPRPKLTPMTGGYRRTPILQCCLVCTLMEVISEPGRFLTFERWTNKAALEGHRVTPGRSRRCSSAWRRRV